MLAAPATPDMPVVAPAPVAAPTTKLSTKSFTSSSVVNSPPCSIALFIIRADCVISVVPSDTAPLATVLRNFLAAEVLPFSTSLSATSPTLMRASCSVGTTPFAPTFSSRPEIVPTATLANALPCVLVSTPACSATSVASPIPMPIPAARAVPPKMAAVTGIAKTPATPAAAPKPNVAAVPTPFSAIIVPT